jgi:hypothetical protein
MKLLLRLSTWSLAALLALLLLSKPIRLVQVLHGGQAFDAVADGLRAGTPDWSLGQVDPAWLGNVVCATPPAPARSSGAGPGSRVVFAPAAPRGPVVSGQ